MIPMIYVAGAGAMAHAAKAMRKMQKRLDKRVAKSRRRAKSRNVESPAGAHESPYTDFPCKVLCRTCGYFVDPVADDGGDPDHPCPVCHDDNWIDLSMRPLVNRMREIETEERNEPPLSAKALALALGLLVFGGTGAGFILAGQWVYGMLVAAASLFALPAAYFTLPRHLAVWMLEGRDRLPDRWSEPVALPEADQAPERMIPGVEIQEPEETIEAPISGRECVAYQLCVLFDMSGDARPPEWVLQEQRAESVRLGEAGTAESEELFLESPVEFVGTVGGTGISTRLPDRTADPDVEYEQIKRFLRQRGLFVTDGEFHFYEARLEPGDEVDVEVFSDDQFVVEHAETPDHDALPDLPDPS